MKENIVSKSIQNAAMFLNCVLFRNSVGLFTIIEKGKKRVVSVGLGTGSSDLIGYTTKTITPDMVGNKVAIFTAIEVKKGDWKPTKKLNKHELNQQKFINKVKDAGGIAGFANSIDVFVNLVKG